jgi:hypothetical protein
MTESQEDALQAAMLAKFVGSSLNQIDSLSIDRRSVPANRLNVNDFVSKVTNSNPNQNRNNVYNQHQANSSGFAAPPPEEVIQRLIPDPIPRSYSDNQPQISNPNTVQNSEKIENILENINKNLELLISLIKNG